jgi:hypothetical protein
MGKNIAEKIWDEHVVHEENGVSILYIDQGQRRGRRGK